MGNCQQCTNAEDSNKTTEIKTKVGNSKQTLDFSEKFTKKNIQGVIKIQALFKGYITRKQYSTLSTQQKHSSPIIMQEISAIDSYNNQNEFANQPLALQLTVNKAYFGNGQDEIKNKDLETNEVQINIHSHEQDDASQFSEVSHPASLKKQFSFDMSALCFRPKNKNDHIQIQTEQLQKLPIIKMINGSYYEGQWKNGKANGFGKYVMADQSSYIGDWLDNQANGFGTFQHCDGEFFMGQWVLNSVQGQGKYTFIDGSYYEGKWENDLPNGEGIQTYPGDWKYEGMFYNGTKHGAGKLLFPDGSIYTGQFQWDLFCCQGKLEFQDGRQYLGEWKNGVKNGKGIFIWPDGRKYDGYYVNDEREGYGILQWPSGQKYLGLWKKGLFHGNGQIVKTNGSSVRGKWINGKKIASKLNTNVSGKTKTSQAD